MKQDISFEDAKKLLKGNARINDLLSLYNLYLTTTDKPDFSDFMSWCKN